MAWHCFDYCRWCDLEHQVFIDEEAEPDWDTVFAYEAPRCAAGLRKFRYSYYSSEEVAQIPSGAVVAHRLRPTPAPLIAAGSQPVGSAGAQSLV